MRSRRVLPLILLALAMSAFAGFSWESIPPGSIRANPIRSASASVRGWVSHNASGRSPAARVASRPTYRFSAPVVGVRAIDQAGEVTELPLIEPIDLGDPLTVPPGTVDVELDLGGPLVLRAGLATRGLELGTLRVAVDEPEALDEGSEIVVDLDVAGALDAVTDADAVALIQDGARGLTP